MSDADGQPVAREDIAGWLGSIEVPAPPVDGDDLRIPVTVVGPRGNEFLQLKLGKVPAGAHLARRLVESIATSLVPPGLRAPNSRFVIVVRDACEIVAVEPVLARKA